MMIFHYIITFHSIDKVLIIHYLIVCVYYINRDTFFCFWEMVHCTVHFSALYVVDRRWSVLLSFCCTVNWTTTWHERKWHGQLVLWCCVSCARTAGVGVAFGTPLRLTTDDVTWRPDFIVGPIGRSLLVLSIFCQYIVYKWCCGRPWTYMEEVGLDLDDDLLSFSGGMFYRSGRSSTWTGTWTGVHEHGVFAWLFDGGVAYSVQLPQDIPVLSHTRAYKNMVHLLYAVDLPLMMMPLFASCVADVLLKWWWWRGSGGVVVFIGDASAARGLGGVLLVNLIDDNERWKNIRRGVFAL